MERLIVTFDDGEAEEFVDYDYCVGPNGELDLAPRNDSRTSFDVLDTEITFAPKTWLSVTVEKDY